MENIVRKKKEIACNKKFLLFSQCFLPYMVLNFHLKCRLQFASIWTSLKFCRLVMGKVKVPVFFPDKRIDVIAVLFTDELGQRLFSLKSRYLQAGKTKSKLDLDTNIGVFVKINHSSNSLCPYYWQSIENCSFRPFEMVGVIINIVLEQKYEGVSCS